MTFAKRMFRGQLHAGSVDCVNIKERRLLNLRRLADLHHKGKLVPIAEKAGTDPNYLYQITGGSRTMGDDLALRIERAYGMAEGSMDRLDEEERAAALSPDVLEIAEAIEKLSPAERSGLRALIGAALNQAHAKTG